MQNNIAEMPVLAHHVEGLQRASVVFLVLKHEATDTCHLGLVILLYLFHHCHLVRVCSSQWELCNNTTFL
jgi:hypothetical protein